MHTPHTPPHRYTHEHTQHTHTTRQVHTCTTHMHTHQHAHRHARVHMDHTHTPHSLSSVRPFPPVSGSPSPSSSPDSLHTGESGPLIHGPALVPTPSPMSCLHGLRMRLPILKLTHPPTFGAIEVAEVLLVGLLGEAAGGPRLVRRPGPTCEADQEGPSSQRGGSSSTQGPVASDLRGATQGSLPLNSSH